MLLIITFPWTLLHKEWNNNNHRLEFSTFIFFQTKCFLWLRDNLVLIVIFYFIIFSTLKLLLFLIERKIQKMYILRNPQEQDQILKKKRWRSIFNLRTFSNFILHLLLFYIERCSSFNGSTIIFCINVFENLQDFVDHNCFTIYWSENNFTDSVMKRM